MCGYDPSEHYEQHLREQQQQEAQAEIDRNGDALEAFTALVNALDPPHAYTPGDVSPKALITARGWIEREMYANPPTKELVVAGGMLCAVLRDCTCAATSYPTDSHEPGCRLEPLDTVDAVVAALRGAGYLVADPAQTREEWVAEPYAPALGDRITARHTVSGRQVNALVVSTEPLQLKLDTGAVFMGRAYDQLTLREKATR